MSNVRDMSGKGREQYLRRLRFWRRSCAEISPLFQSYNLDGDEAPLIFFHGDHEAGGSYLRRIAARIGRPVIGVSPHGTQGDVVPPSIEVMAVDRLALVRSLRPEGPYRLGGFCNGAAVAYEMARLLDAAGQTVEFVALVEPRCLSVRPGFRELHRFLQIVSNRLGGSEDRQVWRVGIVNDWLGRVSRLHRVSPPALWRRLRGSIQRTTRRRRLRDRNAVSSEGISERYLQDRRDFLIDRHRVALNAYLPPHVAFPVIALSSGRDYEGRWCAVYDAVAWKRVCSDFLHIRLPGDHLSCFMENAEHLALELAAIMDGKRDPAAEARADRKPTMKSVLPSVFPTT